MEVNHTVMLPPLVFPGPTHASKGLFTRKSDFALGLQVYNANNIFLFSKMDYHTLKLHPEIERVNSP